MPLNSFIPYLFSLAWLLIPAFSSATEVQDNDPLQVISRIEPYSLSPGQGGEIILELSLPKGFHAYGDQFKFVILEPEGFKYSEFRVDPLIEFYDKFSKKQRTGVEESAIMSLAFEAPPALRKSYSEVKVELTYQACSKTYCLFPTKKEITIPFAWLGPVQFSAENSEPLLSEIKNPGDSILQALQDNLLLAFILVFISGILTSFTPCIFPMIPITLAVLGHDAEKRSRRQNFFLSVFYVHGIALTYSILGLIAASSGQLFGASLGSPVVLSVMCLIFFLMALSMYGVFEIQVPRFLREGFGHKKNPSSSRYFAAFMSGIAAGVVASPCVGPALVTLLSFVAATQDRLLGFFLLFTYAIGLGIIFIVLGVFTELIRKLPRSGPWLEGTKFVLGSLMLGAAFYYLSFLIPQRWHEALLGIALIILGSFFGAFMKVTNKSRLHRVQKGLMQGLLVIGISFLVVAGLNLRPDIPGLKKGPYGTEVQLENWSAYSDERLQAAKAEAHPVIIDVYADWCLACHELDRHTFTDKKVQAALENFVLLRFDATKDSAELQKMKSTYHIMGLPTVLFFDAKGQWRQDLTLTQFEKPEAFLQRIRKLDSTTF